MSINKSICSDCGISLKYYDTVSRIVRTKDRNSSYIKVQRFKCPECGIIRRKLPDYIYPYKQYANKMKALANRARKESVATGRLKYDPNAKEVYSEEVKSLDAKLNVAAKNAPRERRAQAIANSVVKAKLQENKKRSYWQMPCSLGADLSQGDDFCAFTFLFPLSNGCFGIKTRNYITSKTLMKLPAAMRIKYDQFLDEGSLIVLDGTVLDMMQVYEDLDDYIVKCGYDIRCFGYDPYNAKEFVERWISENGGFGVEKVIQGAKTESVPLGELKKLSEDRMLLFDEELMTFAMGNCITLEDTNGNRKLLKKRYEQKIDAVAAMMDAYVAYKLNRDAFD